MPFERLNALKRMHYYAHTTGNTVHVSPINSDFKQAIHTIVSHSHVPKEITFIHAISANVSDYLWRVEMIRFLNVLFIHCKIES